MCSSPTQTRRTNAAFAPTETERTRRRTRREYLPSVCRLEGREGEREELSPHTIPPAQLIRRSTKRQIITPAITVETKDDWFQQMVRGWRKPFRAVESQFTSTSVQDVITSSLRPIGFLLERYDLRVILALMPKVCLVRSRWPLAASSNLNSSQLFCH